MPPETNQVGRYRKKQVEVEAIRWDGQDVGTVWDLLGDSALPAAPDDAHVTPGFGHVPATGELTIPTLEGTVTAQPGDWIIKGVAGELYPCKPDIFEQTYEPVSRDSEVEVSDEAKELAARAIDALYDRPEEAATVEESASAALQAAAPVICAEERERLEAERREECDCDPDYHIAAECRERGCREGRQG